MLETDLIKTITFSYSNKDYIPCQNIYRLFSGRTCKSLIFVVGYWKKEQT